MQILYTIAFCIFGNQVLMLYRYKEPYKDHWNGVGGKIEFGETPDQSIKRELMEEAGLDINDSVRIFNAGVVSWSGWKDKKIDYSGMQLYIIEFPETAINFSSKKISEGILELKSIDWVLDQSNNKIAGNVPHFLSLALASKIKRHYHCLYDEDRFVSLKAFELS